MKFWLNITPGDTVIDKYEIRLKTVSAGLPCIPKNVHFECLEVCELGVCVACHPAVAICLVYKQMYFMSRQQLDFFIIIYKNNINLVTTEMNSFSSVFLHGANKKCAVIKQVTG